VAAIFEAAQPFRAKVILLEDSTKVTQKAAFMWAIFQTHRVVQSFIDVQFKSHPAIVKEISLFMVTEQVDPKEIADLGVKCKKAEADASKATVDLKKLTESHNDLKRKYKSLYADFKIVKAKVKWSEAGAPRAPKRMRLAEPQAAAAFESSRGRITLRGLTSGIISVGDTGKIGSCILLGDQFCAWLPHVQLLGLKIVGILLQTNTLLDAIETRLGNDCDVQVGNWESANMVADILFVDGSATYASLQVATKSGVKLVLSTTRKRTKTLATTG
jgi:hypothetical protein